MYAVPYMVGNGISTVLGIEKSYAKNYLFGMFFIWASTQLLAVPLILLKQSFWVVVILMSAIILGMVVWGVYLNKFPKLCFVSCKLVEKAALIIMVAFMIAMLFSNLFTQHIDQDDSRFVVNAVDMLRTNRMYLTNLVTGEAFETWQGELVKDVTSPWAVYIAFCAKLTCTNAAVMAHTVLPQVLMICSYAVFWLISEVFFKNDIVNRCIFVCLILFLNLYGYYSIYNAETFYLTRLWQGKAVVAAIGIPGIFLISMWLYDTEKYKSHIILLAMLNMAMCLMSGMGLIIGAVMLGCIGMIFGICKKNWKLSVLMWSLCIPNAIYFVINAILG